MKEQTNHKDVLKQSGLKNTRHRNSILDILGSADRAFTAEEVFLELKSRDVSINLSSVYRNLETLVEKGLAVKSGLSGESKVLFELDRKEHKHHIFCMGCNRMFSMEGCPFEEYGRLLKAKTGFDVTGHRLEIYGYCKECSKKTGKDQNQQLTE